MGVFTEGRKFLTNFEKHTSNLPPPLPKNPHPYCADFTDNQFKLPNVFATDNSFSLSTHCMKPCSHNSHTEEEHIFNYQLSRNRRISEYGFGIWSNKLRLFASGTLLITEKTETAVMASLVLHNLLRPKSYDSCAPVGFTDQLAFDVNTVESN